MHKNTISIIILCLTVIILFDSTSILAQAVPSSADGARIDKQLPRTLFPEPDTQSPKAKEKLPITPAPKGAEQYSFTFSGFTIEGMTVYTHDDVASLYKNLLGKQVSLVDMMAVADKLTVKYRNDGYILSKAIIPPQTIGNGTVTLKVIEGYIDNITIDGENKTTTDIVKRYLASIKNSRPLRMQDMERVLLLINDLPGIKARNILSPSKTISGAADLKIILAEKQDIKVFVQVDNRGSRYLGPLQTSTQIITSNFLKRQEAISLQLLTTPDFGKRELDYVSIAYREKIGHLGTSISARGSLTKTSPGFDLSEFDVKGNSNSLSISVKQPLKRSRTTNINLGLQFDISNTVREDNLSTTKIKDRLRVLRAKINAQHYDRFAGITSGNIDISQGINIGGTTKTGTANMTRTLGVSDFFKVNGEISRTQRITKKVQLIAGVTGQKSANILLSSEEFGIGGANYGRAYDGSEITGEDGIAAKIELHVYNPYPIKFLKKYQIYTWYDAGKVWDRDNNIVKDKQRSIASTGVGLQSDLGKDMSLITELAFPLTRKVDVEGNTDPRLFVTLSARF